MTLPFGYSPCPNDTFIFWAWAHGHLSTGVSLRPYLADIQELNRLALSENRLPLTKVSASTYLNPLVRERYRLLDVGAALGRGCGPLIVSRTAWESTPPPGLRLAVPGFDTTACRLARAALGEQVAEWVELRYDDIMPATLDGRVDAGVIIHESRFTYRSHGLVLALDLGSWWEELTGLPLPLGVMVADRTLGEPVIACVESALRESLRVAWGLFEAAPESEPKRALWSYLRENAVELDDATMAAHIQLYVNSFSESLGTEGREALERFANLPS